MLLPAADVPPPVSGARIMECNQTDPLVTIIFEHLEPADRVKSVDEFWLRYSVDQEVKKFFVYFFFAKKLGIIFLIDIFIYLCIPLIK